MTHPTITRQEALMAGGGDCDSWSERNRRTVLGALRIMRQRLDKPEGDLGALLAEYEPGMIQRFTQEAAGER